MIALGNAFLRKSAIQLGCILLVLALLALPAFVLGMLPILQISGWIAIGIWTLNVIRIILLRILRNSLQVFRKALLTSDRMVRRVFIPAEKRFPRTMRFITPDHSVTLFPILMLLIFGMCAVVVRLISGNWP